MLASERFSALAIPDKDSEVFAQLSQLNQQARSEIFERAGSATLSVFPWKEIESRVAETCAKWHLSADEFAAAMRGLHYSWSRMPGSSEAEFVSAIAAYVAERQQANVDEVKSVLVNLLGLSNVSLSARASRLLLESPHALQDVCILTDLRPVFDHDGRTIEACLITHVMKIEAIGSAEERDFFVSLDEDDLDALEEVIARARRKAAALKALAATAGTRIVGAEDES